ncbi:MAG: deiodinase-like protein [Candidatus Paceibacterota bacterium]
MKEYNYNHFSPEDYAHDSFAAPKIGQRAPDFTAYTLDGKVVQLSDFFGQSVVLEIGSLTCPVYAGVLKRMRRLQKEFTEVTFLLLYVREAHPGERRGQAQTNKAKRQRAQECKDIYKDPRMVLVDDVSGKAHKAYGLVPNSVFIIDRNGKIFWRAKWNQPRELRENLRRLTNNQPATGESHSELPGALRPRAFLYGGWVAVWDFIKGFHRLIWLKFLKRR